MLGETIQLRSRHRGWLGGGATYQVSKNINLHPKGMEHNGLAGLFCEGLGRDVTHFCGPGPFTAKC